MNRYFFQAVGILAGTAMGAGIFVLPYVFSQVGILVGILFLSLFALVYFGIHIMYAFLLQKSEGSHHFLYLADRYLPRGLGRFASFIIIAGLLFALLVYLALAPTFAALVFGVNGIGAVLGFWALGTVFIFMGVSRQSFAGFLGVLAIIVTVFAILFASRGEALVVPLVKDVGLFTFFLPFGPILFSLGARSALPQVVELYRESRKKKKAFSLPAAIFIGTVLPAGVYMLFVLGVLKLNHLVSPEALNGLFLSPSLTRLLGILGLLAIWTSYFVIGRNIRDILYVDLHISLMVSWSVPVFFPLVLYLFGFTDFLVVVSIAGGVFAALEGVFVVAMWGRVFKETRWLWIRAPLYAVFFLALGYGVISYVSGI